MDRANMMITRFNKYMNELINKVTSYYEGYTYTIYYGTLI